MSQKLSAAILTILLAAVPAAGQERSGSGGTPTPGASAVADANALFREGIALHDKGEFDKAIEKYRQALELSPDNPAVLYETGLSQFAKKDLDAARAAAEKVVTMKNAPRDAWVLLGNVYDDLKQPAKAIEAYRAGILKSPDFFMLYFNLGIAYQRLGEYRLARLCLENSIAIEPKHASSHFHLGRNYKVEGYRVPAILALTRFLFLEPRSSRSATAMGLLDEIFRAGVKKDSKGNLSITMDAGAAKDEGDFTPAELGISISETLQDLGPDSGHKSDGPAEMDRLASLLTIVGELSSKEVGSGFAAEYYTPLLAELSRRHLAAGYAALALQPLNSPEYDAWTTEHRGEMLDTSKFLATYRWPSKRPVIPPAVTPTPAPEETGAAKGDSPR